MKDAVFAVFGTISALFFFALFSSFCVQGIFSVSKDFYNILKIFGALYLAYLGFKNIFNKKGFKLKDENASFHPKRRKLFGEAFLCCITNPKVLFIYIALLPNYIISGRNILTQNLILSIIQISAVALSMVTYTLVARKASRLFANKMKYVSYISGMVMLLLAGSIFYAK